jgi:hypothetical protein
MATENERVVDEFCKTWETLGLGCSHARFGRVSM